MEFWWNLLPFGDHRGEIGVGYREMLKCCAGHGMKTRQVSGGR